MRPAAAQSGHRPCSRSAQSSHSIAPHTGQPRRERASATRWHMAHSIIDIEKTPLRKEFAGADGPETFPGVCIVSMLRGGAFYASWYFLANASGNGGGRKTPAAGLPWLGAVSEIPANDWFAWGNAASFVNALAWRKAAAFAAGFPLENRLGLRQRVCALPCRFACRFRAVPQRGFLAIANASGRRSGCRIRQWKAAP